MKDGTIQRVLENLRRQNIMDVKGKVLCLDSALASRCNLMLAESERQVVNKNIGCSKNMCI